MPGTAPRARSRLWLIATVQVAVALAVAVGPTVHRAAASHGHVYCPEHLAFEDALPQQDHSLPDQASSALADAGCEARHVACAYSNLSLRPALPACAHGSTAAGSVLRGPALRGDGCASPSVPPLTLAPKHSPPRAVSRLA
jgi:hypothetical protein